MTSPPQLLIFLSCGTPCNKLQEEFIAAVEAQLKPHNWTPKTVGRSVYSARQRVEAARDLIGECHGAVVIGFERTRIIAGLDKPDSATQKETHNKSHPTVWNQMEAAIAYAQRVPILTFLQNGLKRKDMLGDRLELKAIERDLSPTLLTSKEFMGVFSEWIELVRKRSEKIKELEFDHGTLKGRDLASLIMQLSAKQAMRLLLVILAAASSIRSVAFKAGQTWQESTSMHIISPPASTPQPSVPAASTP